MAKPVPVRRRAVAARLAAAALLAGCSTNVRSTSDDAPPLAGAKLPRPDLVLVEDFAVTPTDVRLDSSGRARLTRLVDGTPVDAQRAQKAAEVRHVATATLVDRITAMGLPAQAGSVVPPDRRVVSVRGQVMDVNEGNRTRRKLIGFGAGKSDVGADVQVVYAAPGAAPTLLHSFEADADSGRMPGVAVGMGAGAAAGHVASSAAVSGGLHAASGNRSDAEQEAEKLANGIADALQLLFQRQGWIAAAGG